MAGLRALVAANVKPQNPASVISGEGAGHVRYTEGHAVASPRRGLVGAQAHSIDFVASHGHVDLTVQRSAEFAVGPSASDRGRGVSRCGPRATTRGHPCHRDLPGNPGPSCTAAPPTGSAIADGRRVAATPPGDLPSRVAREIVASMGPIVGTFPDRETGERLLEARGHVQLPRPLNAQGHP